MGIYPIHLNRIRTYHFRGLEFRVSLSNSYERTRWDRMVQGRKEPETLRWIEEELRPGETFIDVGACIGNYSIYAALRHKGLRVFAFEPEPNSMAQLLKNVMLNELPISCFMIACSDQTRLDFFNTHYAFQAGESDHQFGRTIDSQGKEFAPTARIGLFSCSLDEMVRRGILPLPNHVKIDVDGLEALVLNGMREILAHDALKTVLCEISGTEDKVSEIMSRFETMGFDCIRRPGRNEGNYIFKRKRARNAKS